MNKNNEKPKVSEGSKKDSRDAVESAISNAKGDRGITWEATIARSNKKIGKWDAGASTGRKKHATA